MVQEDGVFKIDKEEYKARKHNILLQLQKCLGYTENNINEYMKFDTKITIEKANTGFFGMGKKSYNIKIGETFKDDDGEEYEIIISKIQEEELKNTYGCQDFKVGKSWNAVLIIHAIEEYEYGKKDNLKLYVDSIYTGEDYANGKSQKIDNEKMNLNSDSQVKAADNDEEEMSLVDVADMADKFLKNPVGTLISYFFGMLRDTVGDSMQTLADSLTFSDSKLTYSFSELEEDEFSEWNVYTNVSKYKKGEKINKNDLKKNQKAIIIKKTENQKEENIRFTDKTEIPLIRIDLYNIAADNIPFFDVNFLTVDRTKHSGEDGTPWLYIRNFVTNVIHVVMYIVAAILIIMLIINGIKIMISSLDNPKAQAEHKKALEKFGKALLMLIGSVIIIALCIYGTEMFLKDIKVEDSKELPIRVYVEEAEYSFSTNITGYFRYMAEIQGVNRCLEKAVYTIAYIVVAALNFILAIFMFLRMILMMILAIIGPIIAGLYVTNIKGPMKYSQWVRTYVSLTAIQLLFVIIYRIIFEFTIVSNIQV